jgi:hypothetical protein
MSGFTSLDSFQSQPSIATNISSGNYDFYNPLAQTTQASNFDFDLDQAAAWALPEPQPLSSSSTQPTSSHSRGQQPLLSHISRGNFRTRYPAFARLLPSFFALASAFFMTSVNVLQDIEEDEDAAEEELGTESIMSLPGVGRIALQIITEASGINDQESKLTFYYPSFLRLKWSPVNDVLAHTSAKS